MGGFIRRLFGGGRSNQSARPTTSKATGKPQAVGGDKQAVAKGANRPKGRTVYTSSLGLTPEQRSGINLKNLTGA